MGASSLREEEYELKDGDRMKPITGQTQTNPSESSTHTAGARIVLMGPPGAGKGSISERLADKFGMVHLSSGDILRAERSSGSELGETLKKYMDAGELVPDEIVIKIIIKSISSLDSSKGLLLDGFPRTVIQAKQLDDALAKAGLPIQAVLLLDAPEEVLLKRITGRRICPKCGRVYHIETMPPAKDNICDTCGTKLIHRDDDTEQVVRERINLYHKETEPVIEYYRKSGVKMIEVDADATIDEVVERAIEGIRQANLLEKEGRTSS